MKLFDKYTSLMSMAQMDSSRNISHYLSLGSLDEAKIEIVKRDFPVFIETAQIMAGSNFFEFVCREDYEWIMECYDGLMHPTEYTRPAESCAKTIIQLTSYFISEAKKFYKKKQ